MFSNELEARLNKEHFKTCGPLLFPSLCSLVFSLFIAVLSHLLGLLGTACRRSARFARFARSRVSRARRLGPSWARLGLPKTSRDSSRTLKIAFWRRLGRVLPRLGAVLERLGGILGRLGASLARLGAILGRLGAILKRLGAILARLGRVLTSQNLPKIAPRPLQKHSFSLGFFNVFVI